MNRSLIVLTALMLTGGTALADRTHGTHGGSHNVTPSHNVASRNVGHVNTSHFSGNRYNGGGRVTNSPRYAGNRVVERGGYRGGYRGGNFRSGSFHYVDHGGYRSWTGGRWDRNYFRGYYYNNGFYRPWGGVHYYSYYHRPALIVENYSPMAGFYWVAGSWNWDGAEWMWYPGHFEPL